jgi:2-oxoglutarate/2-oxoacid ferredoxin oxidoreductase subunit beta
MTKPNDYELFETAWCPGCGNFGILDALQTALKELNLKANDVLLVGGIGQAAKLPQFIAVNGLCTLHGRALPGATGAKLANSDLTVIVHSGDGDCYAEGGNHFIHAIRRDIDLTLIVHNNQTYGLTQGQASPTSELKFVTNVQPRGVIARPLNGPALAIALGAGFVARGFSGDAKHLAGLIVRGVKHKGLSFIEVLQPCVSMNKVNTFKWYKDRARYLEADPHYDLKNREAAFIRAEQWGDEISMGVFFEEQRTPFEEHIPTLAKGALVKQPACARSEIEKLLASFY